MSTTPPADEVTAYEPNCAMKRKLGQSFALGALVTEEVISACETLLSDASASFFQEAETDVAALEQLLLSPLEKPGMIDQLQTHAYNIKSHAKVLGFSFITEICVQLIATIVSRKLAPEKKRPLLLKLVQALRLAFTQQVRDDGGAAGQELQAKLMASL